MRRFFIGTAIVSLVMASCFSPLAFAKDETKWIEVRSRIFL
jgi:hypothetical protein